MHILGSCFLLLSILSDYYIAPVLPKEAIAQQFLVAKEGFDERFAPFSDQKFIPFQKGRSDEEIEKEFTQLDRLRQAIWFRNPDSYIKESNPGYEISLPLFFNDQVRVPNCIAFAYNNITPYFNASAIVLNDRLMIACEGTRSKDIPKFFQLLTQYQVTHLVRLTPSYEGEKKKCHPYWEGIVSESADGKKVLQIPVGSGITYPIAYFVDEEWKDGSGVNASRLLQLVLKTRKSLGTGLLAVHCSAGVGRTGTFLAALAIVDAIDHNIAFSIEEIVFRLSLQRVQSVSNAGQYVTLYRLAEEYAKESR